MAHLLPPCGDRARSTGGAPTRPPASELIHRANPASPAALWIPHPRPLASGLTRDAGPQGGRDAAMAHLLPPCGNRAESTGGALVMAPPPFTGMFSALNHYPCYNRTSHRIMFRISL